MGLTYLHQLQDSLPPYMTGTARFQHVDRLLELNPAWKTEAMETLRGLLVRMRDLNASDLDMGGPNANNHVWMRVYGVKGPDRKLPEYCPDEVVVFCLAILNPEQKKILFTNKNMDFSFELMLVDGEKPSRFRGDVYYARNYLAINLRRINARLFDMQELSFPEPVIKRFDLRYEKSGLYLITGITGSGKSSTLDTIVDYNNQRSRGHIIVLGRPLEYIHDSQSCLVQHREMGEDCLNFADGVYQSLRQDPDIIVVGEMRNALTIGTVLEVTDTGHKVFSTLHTSSAIESIHRIIGEFPPIEQERIRHRLADLLKVCVSQKLIPNRANTYTMVKEILSVNESVKAAIRNNNINEVYQMMNEGRAEGMQTLEQDLLNKVRQGQLSKEMALNFANNRKRMRQLLG